MNRAISSIGTLGRNVLGPGRMARSMGSSGSRRNLRAEQSEDDGLLVHDDAGVPSRRAHAPEHVAEPLIHSAGGDAAPSHVSRARELRVRALRGQASGQPIQLALRVVVDVGEAEALEPPRGSWADVAGRVPAVDDHGSGRVEGRRRLPLEPSQRQGDRSRQVFLVELRGRQDLDELRALVHQTPNAFAIDPSRHGSLLLRACRRGPRLPGSAARVG